MCWTLSRFSSRATSPFNFKKIKLGGTRSSDWGSWRRQKMLPIPSRPSRDGSADGVEAGSPRHRHLVQGNEHHEQLCQRHFQAHRRRGFPPGSLQQAIDDHESRDPDRRPPVAARWACQARRQWRHQSRHQVHQLQVNWLLVVLWRENKQALIRANQFYSILRANNIWFTIFPLLDSINLYLCGKQNWCELYCLKTHEPSVMDTGRRNYCYY